MAVVALKCPSCNGDIEFDDSREFGFCSFCGTKVMIQEEIQKIKVIHTGSVVVDDSGKAANYLALASSALKNGNYGEAYDYYTKVLELDMKVYQAIFGKGLSAAYMSTSQNPRINELFNALEDVKDIVGLNAEGIPLRFEMQTRVFDCAFGFYGKCNSDEYTSPEEAKAHFDGTERALALTVYALNMLDNAALATDIKYENYYRQIIDSALEMCKKSAKSISYRVGFEAVYDKNGNVRSSPVYKKLSCPYDKEIREYAQAMKNTYNNLPSTLAQIAEYDNTAVNLQNNIADYNNSLAAYFFANPDDEKTYRHSGLFGSKKKRAAIEAKFSNELLAKKETSEMSEKRLSELAKIRKQFIAANIKK